MSKVLSLDFLTEPVQPAGKVTLGGVEYELFRADIMENFLSLWAMVEKAAENGKSKDADPLKFPEEMERLRQDMRNMIRVLVPGLSDELLREKFPKLLQLQQVFTMLVTEANKRLPESVKKNCETTPREPVKVEAESAKTSLSQ